MNCENCKFWNDFRGFKPSEAFKNLGKCQNLELNILMAEGSLITAGDWGCVQFVQKAQGAPEFQHLYRP